MRWRAPTPPPDPTADKIYIWRRPWDSYAKTGEGFRRHEATYRLVSNLLIEMSKAVKSAKWFVRIDGKLDDLKQACVKFANMVDVIAMLGYYHKGSDSENPHCHFVVEMSTLLQKQSLVVRYKSVFDWELSRSDHACAVWDGNRAMGAVSYLFHEEDVVQLVNKGFSNEDIDLAISANKSVQKVMESNKEKASNKLVELAIQQFSNPGIEGGKYNILKFMLMRCKQGLNHFPGMFLLKRYVEEVELKLVEEDQFENYVSHVANNLWRQ